MHMLACTCLHVHDTLDTLRTVATTIGYLTDTHLRKHVPGTSAVETRLCRKMPDLMPRALAGMREASPVMIVCTGDVVDVSTGPGAIEDLKLCRRLLDECGLPYIILPGNHDPLPDDFYRFFPMPERKTVLNDCELISFHDDACFNGEQTSRRSVQSLREMTELLGQPGCSPGATVLLQHYIVYPDLRKGYPHNYENDDEIRGILEWSDRRLLSISGHYHPGIPLTERSGVSYFAGRAFCEPPHTCYIISISGDRILVEGLDIAEEADS